MILVGKHNKTTVDIINNVSAHSLKNVSRPLMNSDVRLTGICNRM